MSKVFANYARYYDALYSDKDYAAESAYFAGLMKRFETIQAQDVLEFGAGSGGHQAGFRDQGYRIQGVDLSQDMCDLATERGAQVVQGDFRDYHHPGPCDAVIALFHVVSYLVTDDDLDLGFRNVRRHLSPGSLFVFDVWFEDAVVSERPETRVKRVSKLGLDIVRIAEPHWNPAVKSVQVDYTVFARESTSDSWEMTTEHHLLRYFSLEDLRGIASRTGFTLLHAEETLTGAPPSANTWGVSVVLAAV